MTMPTADPWLLALDIGRTTGGAWGPLSARFPDYAVWRLPTRDKLDVVGARIVHLRGNLATLFDTITPTYVVMAERFPARNMGEASSNLALDGVVRAECWRRKIKLMVQPEGTVRKEMLGKGAGSSEEMKQLAVAWCQKQGIALSEHDAADAAVMWWWTRQELIKRSGALAAPAAAKPARASRRSTSKKRRQA